MRVVTWRAGQKRKRERTFTLRGTGSSALGYDNPTTDPVQISLSAVEDGDKDEPERIIVTFTLADDPEHLEHLVQRLQALREHQLRKDTP